MTMTPQECADALSCALLSLERIPADASSPLYRARLTAWLEASRTESLARGLAELAERIEAEGGEVRVAAIIAPRRETVYLAHARITLDEAGWPVWTWAGDYVQHPDYQSALDAARGGTVCLHVLELIPVDGARIMPELAQHVRAALGTVPR